MVKGVLVSGSSTISRQAHSRRSRLLLSYMCSARSMAIIPNPNGCSEQLVEVFNLHYYMYGVGKQSTIMAEITCSCVDRSGCTRAGGILVDDEVSLIATLDLRRHRATNRAPVATCTTKSGHRRQWKRLPIPWRQEESDKSQLTRCLRRGLAAKVPGKGGARQEFAGRRIAVQAE